MLPTGTLRDMFSSISSQLEFMQRTVAERNSLSLGVIAVREFETTDVAYCDAADAFEKLA